MIKHINADELDILRERFEDIVRLKKLLMEGKISNFLKQNINLNDAVNVFLAFCSMEINVQEDIYSIFTSILKEKALLDTISMNIIERGTFNYDDTYSEEEYDSKVEEYYDIDEFRSDLDTIIGCVSKKINIKYGSAMFTEIIFNVDYVDDELRNIYEDNKDTFEDLSNSDDPMEEFYQDFCEDATIYYFKGIIFPDRLINLFNKSVGSNWNGGFATEIYTLGNNSYLTISDSLFNEPISIRIILILFCSLLMGGKYDN